MVPIATIYLIRHGTTDWNQERRAQGQADIQLNEAGRVRAAEAAELLRDAGLVAVYSSDLIRATDTAQLIAKGHGVRVQLDRDLREIDQGDWTGRTIDEIVQRWPEARGRLRHNLRRPGGESPEQVRSRALGALRRILAAHPNGEVAIVSHGVTIRCLLATAMGYPADRTSEVRGLATGGVVRLDAVVEGDSLTFGEIERLDERTPRADDPNA